MKIDVHRYVGIFKITLLLSALMSAVQGAVKPKGDERMDVKLSMKGLRDTTKSKFEVQHKRKNSTKMRIATSTSKSESTNNPTTRMPTLKKTSIMKPSLPSKLYKRTAVNSKRRGVY